MNSFYKSMSENYKSKVNNEDGIEPPSTGIKWTETEGDCVTIND